MKWHLSQIGRRENYTLPRELQRRGELASFYTDVWANWAQGLPLPHSLKARFASGMEAARVGSSGLLAALHDRIECGEQTRRWAWSGLRFGTRAARHFRLAGIDRNAVVLGYTCGNLEQLELARDIGACGLHVQVDPGPAWYRTRKAAQASAPGCARPFSEPSDEFIGRILAEVRAANKVIVHSEHSRLSLRDEGVPESKMAVVPPAFDPVGVLLPRPIRHGHPLRVLFVGYLCVSKGFHVLVEASRALGREFEFTAVGESRMLEDYLRSAAYRFRLTGRLSRQGVIAELGKADVLVFPTLSDGFGLVQLEAMAAGVPVIATSNCGAVVQQGVNGLVVPAGDPDALEKALRRLHDDRVLLAEMSAAAPARACEFSSERHLTALLALAS